MLKWLVNSEFEVRFQFNPFYRFDNPAEMEWASGRWTQGWAWVPYINLEYNKENHNSNKFQFIFNWLFLKINFAIDDGTW